LLAEQLEVKEVVNRALLSVTVVEVKAEDQVPKQVAQLEEVIQQLQQCIADLELRIVPETPQDVRDQREATARSAVERLKDLTLECKQLTDHSALTYERLTKSPELRALESQLQEVKYQAEKIQAQLKPLSAVERMKRSHEQMDHPVADPHYPKQSYGDNSETPTSTRQGLSIMYRGRRPRSRARVGCHYS
jgi:phage shock protein A